MPLRVNKKYLLEAKCIETLIHLEPGMGWNIWKKIYIYVFDFQILRFYKRGTNYLVETVTFWTVVLKLDEY